MIAKFFDFLVLIDEFLWSYVGFTLLMVLGLWLSVRFRFGQLLQFPQVVSLFFRSIKKDETRCAHGVHPLHAFFASVGGCLGIGNIVSVCTAVKIGGPGAIFWMWTAAFFGMIIKYCEVYLGVKFRIANGRGGFDGGPMFYLRRVFRTPFVPVLVCIMLAIYGTEIYMFHVVTESVSTNWHVPRGIVIGLFLALIVFAGLGGVNRVGRICSTLVPIFVVIFITMGAWVLLKNYQLIVPALTTVMTSAFTGHAAVGAFAGSTLMLTISQGIARGCYTGDIGIGYAGVAQAETNETLPHRQAALSIFGIFLDTFVICSISTFLIIVTDVWQQDIPSSYLVQTALSAYFPHMDLFMPFLLFLLGYSAIIAFFCVGVKCARYLSPQWGEKAYYVYSVSSFLTFSFLDQTHALTVMSLSGATLLVLNVIGIFALRREVEFNTY